jgi:hypothetical protein
MEDFDFIIPDPYESTRVSDSILLRLELRQCSNYDGLCSRGQNMLIKSNLDPEGGRVAANDGVVTSQTASQSAIYIKGNGCKLFCVK